MVRGTVKIYELAKYVGVEPHRLVEVVRRLGIDVKSHMSALGTEEVRIVREHYNKGSQTKVAKPASGTATSVASPRPKGSVVEKRVGSRVIRRRRVAKPAAAPPPPPETSEESRVPLQAPEPEVGSEPNLTEAKAAPTPAPPPAEPIEENLTQTPEPIEAQPEEPEVVAEPEEEAAPAASGRRLIEPLIKRTSTEDHLSQKVGPKPAVPVKKEKKKASEETSTEASGPRRYKEVDITTAKAPEQAKTAKRRLLQRQSGAFRSADFIKRELSHATRKKKPVINRPSQKTKITTPAAHKRIVEMGKSISVGDFAKAMGTKGGKVIEKLMNLGEEATINQSIDFDTATLVAAEFQYEVKQQVFREEDFIAPVDESPEASEPRSAVVTVMGHVDHGKTSLLDAIRKTKVASREHGGITQHIGAYQVKLKKGTLTFIDTPGHEAFTEMRARGAKVTDLVILVVSAVDGVMPQTLESISHAKAAGVPIVVAINKIDLPEANTEKAKQTLAGHELTPEDWGGDTIFCPVSAKTGKGLDELLESVLLQAEVLELKANHKADARGIIIESRLDKHRGPMVTVLVRAGVLKVGDLVVCGTSFGKVKALTDATNQRVKSAGPSVPVEILGLSEVPKTGDELCVVKDERVARELTQRRKDQERSSRVQEQPKKTLEELMAEPSTAKELRVVLKSDVQGSIEALKQTFTKFPEEKAKVTVLHSATGGITESDIMLAAASDGVVLGFNVRPDVKAQKMADREKVRLSTHTVIYDLIDEVKALLEGLLDKVVNEKVIGRAQVRETFQVPKVGMVAGSAVIDGKVTRNCYLRLLRESRVVYEGKISSLRRFKDDVKEVQSGYECGISLENFNDVKTGDELEAYVQEETKVTL